MILGEQKRIVKVGKERMKERRKFGVGAISLIPLRPLWWQSRACTAWRWRRFESEGVKVFLTLVLSTYLVMDVSDRGFGLGELACRCGRCARLARR